MAEFVASGGCQRNQAESAAADDRRERLSLPVRGCYLRPCGAHGNADGARARRQATADARRKFTPPATSGGRCAMARELDDAILMLRTNELELGLLLLKTSGSIDAVLANEQVMLAAPPRLAGARNHRAVAANFCAARCFVAQHVRDHRAGFMLCRHPVGAGAGGRPQLHAGAAGGRGVAPKIALDGFNFGLLPAVNGHSRLETRFCGDRSRAARNSKRTRTSRSDRSRRWNSVWSRSRPTISTGKTKCASPSKSAHRSRLTR